MKLSHRWRLLRVSVIFTVVALVLTAALTAMGQQSVPIPRSWCTDILHTLHQFSDRSVASIVNGRMEGRRWTKIDLYVKAMVRGKITDIVLTADTIQFTEKDPLCAVRKL